MFMRSIEGCHEVLQRDHVRFYSADEYGLSAVTLADANDTVSPLTMVIKFNAEKLKFGFRYVGDTPFDCVSISDVNGSFTFTFDDRTERHQFFEFYGLEA